MAKQPGILRQAMRQAEKAKQKSFKLGSSTFDIQQTKKTQGGKATTRAKKRA